MKGHQISHTINISWIHRKIWKCKLKDSQLEYDITRNLQRPPEHKGNESPKLQFLNGGCSFGSSNRTVLLDLKIVFLLIKYLLSWILCPESVYWAAPDNTTVRAHRCRLTMLVHPVGTGLCDAEGSSWARGTYHNPSESTVRFRCGST